MNNDYECPRCHNIFPLQNKIMHDARCTEQNPLPLDESRKNINGQEFKEENKIPEEKKEEINIPKKEINEIKKPPSGEFPEIFECNICHQIFPESERNDHMLCHNLEKEEKNNQNVFQVSPEEVERQKEIEKQIERNKRNNLSNNNNRNNNGNNSNNNGRNNPFYPNLGDSDIDMQVPNGNFNTGNFLDNLRNIISFQQSSNMNMNNNNGGQNRGNSHINNFVRIETIGPNGQRTVQTYQNNGNNGQNESQPPINFFSSSSSGRRQIPFMSFNQGMFDDIFSEFLQRMGSREHPTDEEILNELPETKIEDVNKLDPEKKNCIICLEDFKNGDNAIILPCIHIFHTDCIKNWLKTQNTCPICKFKLTGENMNAGNGNM